MTFAQWNLSSTTVSFFGGCTATCRLRTELALRCRASATNGCSFDRRLGYRRGLRGGDRGHVRSEASFVPAREGSTGVRVSIHLKGHHRRCLRYHRSARVKVGDAVSVAYLPAYGACARDCPRLHPAQEFLEVPSQTAPLNLRTISTTSSLGRALVGHGLGDTVVLTTATGRRRIRIVAVRRTT